MAKILISCGEPSGDMYAGALAVELRHCEPAAEIFGLGGQRLRAGGGQLLADYRGLSVTGLVEAVRVLPRSLRVLSDLLEFVRAERPDVLVAIDFPDFNFRLAAAVKRLGVPVVYYIGPQLWAWRPRRIHLMKRFVDLVLVIFPFEEAIYRAAGVPVQFVGHPLIDLARAREPRGSFLKGLGFDPDAPVVTLLPGSRRNEVSRLLPVLSRAARLVADRVPTVQFLVARAPDLDDSLFADVDWQGLRPAIVLSRPDDSLAAADVAVTASGTATVQAALHERPMVVVYRLSPVTYWLGRRFVRLDTFAMANLIAGRRIVPELIQDACTPEAIATEVLSYLADDGRAREVSQALREVRARLGAPGASLRAAEAVLRVARGAGGARGAAQGG
jgi:lipid-A-disaccharide synthase